MVWEGLLTEALTICRGIHDRYHPAKHNPFNEVECGDHYARALASWGVYTALAGFGYDGPAGHIGLSPRITPESFQAAFTGSEGWGSFRQERTRDAQHETIELRWGHLSVKSLAFAIPETWRSASATVLYGPETVRRQNLTPAEHGRVAIDLTDTIRLAAGDTIEVQIRRTDN
jgi:hypothetical protein